MSIFFQAFNRAGSTGNPMTDSGGSAQLIITLVGVGLALVAIGLILNAWLKFARLSQALIVSLAWLERDETDITIFFDWLVFSEKTAEVTSDQSVEEIDLDAADNTLVSQILKSLGLAWAMLLIVSPLTSLVGVFFSQTTLHSQRARCLDKTRRLPIIHGTGDDGEK